METSKRSQSSAFSLVEIALVIGVLAVSFIPLVALLPSGLQQFRGALNVSVCAQIAQRVVNDAAQSDFDTLIDRKGLGPHANEAGFTFRAPEVNKPGLRYFDDQGTEVVPAVDGVLSESEKLRIVYQVNVRVMPQAAVPASEKATLGNLAPQLALITVQVAFAPPVVNLAFNEQDEDEESPPADRNLFQPRRGLEIFTYPALIGRGL